jgi:uncharacterized protein (DUF697 family)
MSPDTPTRPSVTAQEPVAVYTAVATLVALVAGLFGVVLDPSVVVQGLLAVVGFGSYIVAAVKARRKVTPLADPYFD